MCILIPFYTISVPSIEVTRAMFILNTDVDTHTQTTLRPPVQGEKRNKKTNSLSV